MFSKKTMMVALVLTAAACTEQEPATDEAAVDTAAVSEAQAPASAPNAFLDPNSATEAELRAAGLDSAQAAQLVAARPFTSMTAVDSVLQLDSARAEAVYARLWMPLDLNTASGAEIMLIPGVGNRMRHEFEEYRPYRGIEQFRREIGKYVDEAEVARLERYVTIR